MKTTLLKIVVGLVILGLLGFSVRSCQTSSARVKELERQSVVDDSVHQVALEAALQAKGEAEESDVAVEEGEAETRIIVRRVTKDISRQLQIAADAEDTMRVVLREVYPDLEPTLDHLVAAHTTIASNKDRIIARDSVSLALMTESRDEWRTSSGKMEQRAIRAEDGWANSKALVKELKKGDINIFGLHLDATCGPGVMVGVTTSGGFGAALGAGCVIGV